MLLHALFLSSSLIFSSSSSLLAAAAAQWSSSWHECYTMTGCVLSSGVGTKKRASDVSAHTHTHAEMKSEKERGKKNFSIASLCKRFQCLSSVTHISSAPSLLPLRCSCASPLGFFPLLFALFMLTTLLSHPPTTTTMSHTHTHTTSPQRSAAQHGWNDAAAAAAESQRTLGGKQAKQIQPYITRALLPNYTLQWTGRLAEINRRRSRGETYTMHKKTTSNQAIQDWQNKQMLTFKASHKVVITIFPKAAEEEMPFELCRCALIICTVTWKKCVKQILELRCHEP